MNSAMHAKVIDLRSKPINQRFQTSKTITPQTTPHRTIYLDLQKSIEFDEVLRSFNHEINSRIPWCSLSYEHPTHNLECIFGTSKRHQVNYLLKIDETELGHFSLSKDDHFTKRELQLLESLMCSLLYPLYNAIKYYQALRMATTDDLTGLGNRHALKQNLERELNIATRHHCHLSVLMIDIDFFKKINDSYGHLVGDKVLKHIAESIRCITRGSDLAFRYGGEEFVILLCNTDVNGATLFAHRLRLTIEQLPCECQNKIISATVSIGVTEYLLGDSADQVLDKADEALYAAKDRGRNCVSSYHQ
ncbi:MAG: GGDEF domain-containing protein [Pseudomonadota bacterium]